MLSPATTDREQAQQRLTSMPARTSAFEGIVANGLAQRCRRRRKRLAQHRYLDTVDVIVGAVTGSLTLPERLILGLCRDGDIVGGTSALSDDQQRLLAPLLAPPTGTHPWPEVIGGGHVGYWGNKNVEVIRVQPELVVEVGADTAFEYGRWRHLTTFIRPTTRQLDLAAVARHRLGPPADRRRSSLADLRRYCRGDEVEG
jgi:hypothetical protein